MINVKTAYPLDISGKIEGEKGNKEAELVLLVSVVFLAARISEFHLSTAVQICEFSYT